MSRLELAIEHFVLKDLKTIEALPKTVLLAISGGLDSIVMGEILLRWSRSLDLNLAVAHVHHGASNDEYQRDHRDRAQNYVQQWARKNALPFFTNTPDLSKCLKTEQQFRELREANFLEWKTQSGAEAVAYAHHREDLLETRLIRLIRGSGNQGLRSMSPLKNGKLRPLLGLSREEIQNYARIRGLSFVEDPSNEKSDYLRNWIRREWLPLLESRRPGAKKALSRSLQTLTSSVKDQGLEVELAQFVGLRRESLEQVSSSKKREVLAGYLMSLGLKNYAETHVSEIIKRLDAPNSEFELLGLNWRITPDLLWASRV